jgi:hypothetical protein
MLTETESQGWGEHLIFIIYSYQFKYLCLLPGFPFPGTAIAIFALRAWTWCDGVPEAGVSNIGSIYGPAAKAA